MCLLLVELHPGFHAELLPTSPPPSAHPPTHLRDMHHTLHTMLHSTHQTSGCSPAEGAIQHQVGAMYMGTQSSLSAYRYWFPVYWLWPLSLHISMWWHPYQATNLCGGGGHLYWPRLQVCITGPRHLLSCYTRQPAGKEVNYRGRRGMWWCGGLQVWSKEVRCAVCQIWYSVIPLTEHDPSVSEGSTSALVT